MYRIMRWLCRIATPILDLEGTENLPEENVILVGNHAQMFGPIGLNLYPPRSQYTWCTSEMMHLKEVPAYAYKDFWSDKPKYIQWFFHLASYLIAPFSVVCFNTAPTIPVYKDHRVFTTFDLTVQHLMADCDVVIFPEGKTPRNNIINEFQIGFLNVARMYYKKCGKPLTLVPMYLSPELKKIFFGKPVVFNPDVPMPEERRRVNEELMNAVTKLAASQPRHTVIPYTNMVKKDYPKNLPVIKKEIRKEAEHLRNCQK